MDICLRVLLSGLSLKIFLVTENIFGVAPPNITRNDSLQAGSDAADLLARERRVAFDRVEDAPVYPGGVTAVHVNGQASFGMCRRFDTAVLPDVIVTHGA